MVPPSPMVFLFAIAHCRFIQERIFEKAFENTGGGGHCYNDLGLRGIGSPHTFALNTVSDAIASD